MQTVNKNEAKAKFLHFQCYSINKDNPQNPAETQPRGRGHIRVSDFRVEPPGLISSHIIILFTELKSYPLTEPEDCLRAKDLQFSHHTLPSHILPFITASKHPRTCSSVSICSFRNTFPKTNSVYSLLC